MTTDYETTDYETTDNETTDYDRIGGGPAVGAVVDELYRRLTSDDQVSHYFEDVSLPALKRHQALMITSILGGPDRYDGRALDEAHTPLAISHADYDRVGSHLIACLKDAGVPDDIQGRVGEALGQARGSIVTQQH
jgi:hemoglobin